MKNWMLQEAVEQITKAVETIDRDAHESAMDEIMQNSGRLLTTILENDSLIYMSMVGIDDSAREGDAPLTVYVCEDGTVLYKFDPIQFWIDSYTKGVDDAPVPFDDTTRDSFDRAIASLQSGIDRLKAREAECRKAQS